ncbi:MAG: ATP synthase F0 subunit B [Clostridia bacterium]|nr:ATP synthase F0 subunit B [Clostridia bacterium]
MPLNIDIVQVLLHMLNVVILVGGLWLILFKPVKKFTEDRKKHFEEAEEALRKQSAENEKIRVGLEEREAAFGQEMISVRRNAEKDAADAAKAYIDSAKAEAASIIERAEQSAEKRKEHILDSAQTEINELVIGAAQKLLGESASPERTRELYDEFLTQAERTLPRQQKEKKQ